MKRKLNWTGNNCAGTGELALGLGRLWAAGAMALLLLPALGTAATRTVTSLADSGPGSLRDTITIASQGDTIIFNVTGTIPLTSGELVIGKDLRINGPGATNLQASGTLASRVFRVTAGTQEAAAKIRELNGVERAAELLELAFTRRERVRRG